MNIRFEPTVSSVLPEFTAEMESGLRKVGESQLEEQVGALSIWDGCGCGDDFCSSFYTGPRPEAGWRGDHRNVLPSMGSGFVVLDVVDGQIRFVEVLWRDDVKRHLRG